MPCHPWRLGLELDASTATELPAPWPAVPKAGGGACVAGNHGEIGLDDQPAPEALGEHVPALGDHLTDRLAFRPAFDDADAIRVPVAHVRVMFASRVGNYILDGTEPIR
jgi:hypothetical protein